uniref:Uncharacterized protein n=1 Tax=Panagrolaimus davidi TaxID=227884 RepID=A0A914Q5C8_9BILA
MSPENIKKGLEYYEKAEEEQALAISGTSDYIEILEELQDKAGIKETKKNVVLPVITIPKLNPSDKNKKVFIEIKNGAFRICVTEKNGKKNNLIFAYPDDNKFIPMYISFLRETVIIGKQAIKDYKIYPKSVVFDIINVLGKLKHNPPKINPKWGFQLLPISASHEAKLGFKIHTFNGVKLFPVEIIFAILFKYLINIASKHLHIKNIDLRFLQIKLTPLQRICLKDVGKLLNISVNVESHL